MRQIQLKETDNGKKLQLKKGDHLNIKLTSNATTGFNWEMQPNSHFDVSHKYLKEAGAKTGSSGVAVFDLTAEASSKHGSIILLNRRSWEKISGNEEQFRVDYEIG
jgi:inhibitor of cysteine peptidase